MLKLRTVLGGSQNTRASAPVNADPPRITIDRIDRTPNRSPSRPQGTSKSP